MIMHSLTWCAWQFVWIFATLQCYSSRFWNDIKYAAKIFSHVYYHSSILFLHKNHEQHCQSWARKIHKSRRWEKRCNCIPRAIEAFHPPCYEPRNKNSTRMHLLPQLASPLTKNGASDPEIGEQQHGRRSLQLLKT